MKRSVFGLCPIARKTPWQGNSFLFTGSGVSEPDGMDPVFAGSENFYHLLAQLPFELVVAAGAVLHDLRGPELLSPVDDGDLAAESGQIGGFFHRRIAAADHDYLFLLEEETVAGGTGGDPVPHEVTFRLQAEELGAGAGRHDQAVTGIGALVAHHPGRGREERSTEVACSNLTMAPNLLAWSRILSHQLGSENPLWEIPG